MVSVVIRHAVYYRIALSIIEKNHAAIDVVGGSQVIEWEGA